MKKRIIFQAGFHKTGNKTIQSLFRDNAKLLAPYCQSKFKWNIADLNAAAHAFGTLPVPYRRNQLRRKIRTASSGLAKISNENICVFAEDLCGPLPGLNGVPDYGQAAIIAKELVRITKQELGDNTQVELFYTTREGAAWMNSLYRHHILDGQLVQSFDQFVDTYPEAMDMNFALKQITKKSGADAVHIQRLEDCVENRLGPAQGMLDILGVPIDACASISPIGRVHQGISTELAAQFLALNKQIQDPEKLQSMKRTIMNGG